MQEVLKDKLKILAEDELALQAINMVFCEQIEQVKPKIESGDSNEILGEKYRAYETAKIMLAKAMDDFASRKHYYKATNFNKAK